MGLTSRGGLRIAWKTDAGGRSRNEDAHLVLRSEAPECTLLAVADGMGGQGAGAEVAAVVVSTLRAVFPRLVAAANAPRAALALGLEEVVSRVREFRAGRPDRARAGSTLTALFLGPRGALWAHVGDSRLWRHRAAGWEKLTEDHNLAGRLVREGVLAEEEALTSPMRARLYRYLGKEGAAPEAIDVGELPVAPGDGFLLHTDGLLAGGRPPRWAADANDAYNPDELLATIFAAGVDLEDNATAIAVAIH